MATAETTASVAPASGCRRIGFLDLTAMTLASAVDALHRAVKERRGGLWTFANAHTVNTARRFPEFRRALSSAVIFNDGVGVDLAGRLLYGKPFPANLNGTDFTPALLASLDEPTPVYVVGSPPGVAEEAATILAERYPNMVVAGSHHGFFAESEEPLIAARIVASGARLVLVGMGHPQQELWAARNTASIDAPLLCVGAFLDFSAGRVPRAPAFVRWWRLEWLFRMIMEPRRLARRYLIGNAAFLWSVLRQYLHRA